MNLIHQQLMKMGLSESPDIQQITLPVGYGVVGFGIGHLHGVPAGVVFTLASESMDPGRTYDFPMLTYGPIAFTFRTAADVSPIIEIFQQLQKEMQQAEYENRMSANSDPPVASANMGDGAVYQ